MATATKAKKRNKTSQRGRPTELSDPPERNVWRATQDIAKLLHKAAAARGMKRKWENKIDPVKLGVALGVSDTRAIQLLDGRTINLRTMCNIFRTLGYRVTFNITEYVPYADEKKPKK